MTCDTQSFARLVSLACHDLRTPLTAIGGFAQTLARIGTLDERSSRFIEHIAHGAAELGEVIDRLSLIARVEDGRFQPVLEPADTLALAHAVRDQLGADAVAVEGSGGIILADPETTVSALVALGASALRHGGLEQIRLAAASATLRLTPLSDAVGAILLGPDPRDLGAACGSRLLGAVGASLEVGHGSLEIGFRTAEDHSEAGMGPLGLPDAAQQEEGNAQNAPTRKPR